MLTVAPMLRAPLHFKAVRTCSIAVAAARTTGAVVVNPQADSAQRAGAFDHVTNSGFRLAAQRLAVRRYLGGGGRLGAHGCSLFPLGSD
jgi:hypothetical protein